MINTLITSYGVIMTLVVLLVVALVTVIALVGRTWLERWARQGLEKDLETHKAQLALSADSLRAQFQTKLHELSLFSTERHRAYAQTYKHLLRAEGAHSNLVASWGSSDFSDAVRSELDDLLKKHKVPAPVARQALDAWDEDPDDGRLIDEAIDAARLGRAGRLFQRFRNTQLMNELYFSPEVSRAVEEANHALARLSAELQVSGHHRYQEQERKKQEAQLAVQAVRRAMQQDLHERNVLAVESRHGKRDVS